MSTINYKDVVTNMAMSRRGKTAIPEPPIPENIMVWLHIAQVRPVWQKIANYWYLERSTVPESAIVRNPTAKLYPHWSIQTMSWEFHENVWKAAIKHVLEGQGTMIYGHEHTDMPPYNRREPPWRS